MVALAELPQEAVEEDEAGEVHEVCGHRAKERRPNAREEPSRAAAGDGERGESAGTRGGVGVDLEQRLDAVDGEDNEPRRRARRDPAQAVAQALAHAGDAQRLLL